MQQTPLPLLQSTIALFSDNLTSVQSMAKCILDSSADTRNRTVAATTCIETLANSQHCISLSTDALPRSKTKDAQAWLSAAFGYLSDCHSSLEKVNDNKKVDL